MVAVDLHCGQIQGFFGPRVPVDNLDGGVIGVSYFGDTDLHNPGEHPQSVSAPAAGRSPVGFHVLGFLVPRCVGDGFSRCRSADPSTVIKPVYARRSTDERVKNCTSLVLSLSVSGGFSRRRRRLPREEVPGGIGDSVRTRRGVGHDHQAEGYVQRGEVVTR